MKIEKMKRQEGKSRKLALLMAKNENSVIIVPTAKAKENFSKYIK